MMFRRTAKSRKTDGPVTSPNGVVYANQAAMDYWMPVLERKATVTPASAAYRRRPRETMTERAARPLGLPPPPDPTATD